MIKEKSVLLIGGAGYVGNVIAIHFLSLGYRVRVLDNFIYSHDFAIKELIENEKYEFVFGDFSDFQKLDEVSMNIENVVILGGLVGDPITKAYPLESTLINEKGVFSCMDYFDDKPISKLIFISTCSNYGLIGENELADENFELNPLSLYAKAKVSAEFHLLSKRNKVNYTATILRFATAFGLSPRMRFDLSISEFVRDIYFGEELQVFDENTWRPYCHISDFARLIELVFKAESKKVDFEVFNAGGDLNNFTKKMIVDTIISYVPNAKVKYVANGTDPRNYRVSFKKVKDILGFEPNYSVNYGVEELLGAFQKGLYLDSTSNKDKYGNYKIV
jgi:nucleoside-diphosphate-sugar epimerase